VCHVSQIQEFRTGATRQNMETVHAKEEAKRLRSQLTELRDKLNELEARVRSSLDLADFVTHVRQLCCKLVLFLAASVRLSVCVCVCPHKISKTTCRKLM